MPKKTTHKITETDELICIDASEPIQFSGSIHVTVKKLTHYKVGDKVTGVFDTGTHSVSDQLAVIFDALKFPRV